MNGYQKTALAKSGFFNLTTVTRDGECYESLSIKEVM